MNRAYYSDTISAFLATEPRAIQGDLNTNSGGAVDPAQIGAWAHQIELLQSVLPGLAGKIYFEYSIPRMGRRIDVVLVIGAVIFVLEFKVGALTYAPYAADQVWDYALDLKNFHATSHNVTIAPVLIALEANAVAYQIVATP